MRTISVLLLSGFIVIFGIQCCPAGTIEEDTSVSVEIDDALQLVRKYFAEHRMLQKHFIITSAVLRNREKEKTPYWEITLEKRQKVKRLTHLVLEVKMDGSVERVERELQEKAKE